MQHDSRFSGRLTALLTMAGVAIGLGNVWRFPYMMGQHGGSAFLLLYLLLMALFAIPALMAEWTLGRSTRSDTVGALGKALGGAGTLLAAVLVLGILVADSYYMVVIGNILYTTAFAAWPGFDAATFADHAAGLQRGALQYGCAVAVLLCGLWVLHRGLHRGIETVSRWFVPFFGVVVIYLVIHTLVLPGAASALWQFLRPDFSRIGLTELYAAAGQTCFSLGVGGTFMVVYGSYLRDEDSIPRQAVETAGTDTLAALLATLFIVPAVLALGLDLAAGPSLIFDTLPQLFAAIPLGRLVGFSFLLALTLMAFLSAVAGLVVCVQGAMHLPGVTRGRALLAVGLLELGLMFPSAYWPWLIGHLDMIFGSGMQILGAAIAIIAVTRGLRARVLDEAVMQRLPGALAGVARLWIHWVVPAVLLAILAGYVMEQVQR